jgi:hypothetical protein
MAKHSKELLDAGTEFGPDWGAMILNSAEVPMPDTAYRVIGDEEASSEERNKAEPEDDEGNENGAGDSGEENGRTTRSRLFGQRRW